jgi:lantibiotic modifying enzyme
MLTLKVKIFILNPEISTLNIRDTMHQNKERKKQSLESIQVHKKKRGVLNLIKQLNHQKHLFIRLSCALISMKWLG